MQLLRKGSSWIQGILILLILNNNNFLFSGEITTLLKEKMEGVSSTEKIPIIIYLRDQVDLDQMEEVLKMSVPLGERIPLELRYKTIITALMNIADRTQPELIIRMQELATSESISDIQLFWIRNIISAQAIPQIIKEIANWEEVEAVYYDGKLELEMPVYSYPAEAKTNSSEPGLRAINAHKLWDLGYTGAGRLVMDINTGVNGNNTSLKDRWRGTLPGVRPTWAWHDIAYGTTFPSEWGYYGTYRMGILCGRDPITNDTIGVAPDAYWIASNALVGPSPITSRVLLALQWAANPDSNINTMYDVPDALSFLHLDPNVITDPCSTNIGYFTVIDALESIKPAVIFLAGDYGPGDTTIRWFANVNKTAVNVFAVGAIDGHNPSFPITDFSSRGPSKCSGPDSLMFKPEVVAPGLNIRSTSGINQYHVISGTGSAAQHVVGAIALLRQIDPDLTAKELKYLLLNSATDLGTPGEDNIYGMGIIDLWKAYQQIITSVPLQNPIPLVFKIEQNYPNPFNSKTLIKYELPVESAVTLKIFNVLGQEVKTIVNEVQKSGYYSIEWEAVDEKNQPVASGVYFYRIEVKDVNNSNRIFIQQNKLLLLK